MRKHNLLQGIVVLLLGFQLVWAGSTGKISGRITDNSTGEPMIGANVVVQGLGVGAATDIEGEFYIINIPVGNYSLLINMIGYQAITLTEVRVRADLTTPVDLEMQATILESGESVIVEAKRPLIQKDLTASRNIMTSEDIENIPVQDVDDIVELSGGFVDGHARGGRMGEVVYMVNGVSVVDPMSNNFEAEVPQSAVEEISIYTGGFSAEYSNAQSGVVNIITKEGGTNYSGKLRYRTSSLGAEEDATLMNDRDKFFNINDHHRLQDLEYSFGGPLPLLPLSFFVSGEIRNDLGRFDHNYDNLNSFNWKMVYRATQQDKIAFSGLYAVSDDGRYVHGYRKATYENEDLDFDGILDRTKTPVLGDPEYYEIDSDGNVVGPKRYILVEDDLDADGNPLLDDNGNPIHGDGDFVHEDRNLDGMMTIEDLNHDGRTDGVLDMLDHVQEYDRTNNQFALNWSHSISATSFFEVNLSRYRTNLHYNINERGEEWDANDNGVFDEDEDYNGNWKEDGTGTWDNPDWDLLTDSDDDDFIDASQYPDWNPNKDISDWGSKVGDEDTWMSWEDVELGDGAEDGDKLKMYGTGRNYDRFRWNNDEKTVYTFKTNYTNQWNKKNTMRSGIEYTQYSIFAHDVDIASGGNVYGANVGAIDGHGREDQAELEPFLAGFFTENKMEYDGMIVNAGLRFDYFDPKTPRYEVNSSEEISDTISVNAKYYLSPRLGVAHPITERDVFYFNYGQYFQIPVFNRLYDNLNWDLSGAFPRVGNPDLQPERTTSYEIGVRHQFTDNLVAEVKGFYKDISGLVSTRQEYYSASNYYSIFVNTDYGNVRGIEFSLDKRFSNYFGGSIDYSFAVAKGKASSPTAQSSQVWAGQVVPKKEQYLDWDQRHTLFVILNYEIPRTGIHGNFTTAYGSGFPYTAPSYSLDVPLNTERLPATLDSDMFLEKEFGLSNYGAFQIFLWVNNVFSLRNYNSAWATRSGGGLDDDNWFMNFTKIQERYEDEDAVFFGSEDDNNGIDDDQDGFIDETLKDEYMVLMDTDGDGEVDDSKLYPAGGKLGDPRYYAEPRVWRLGISYKF
ncbi:TonB-dependent receptor [bacterium]|nr:TonB-dependent receptor [bacterium]